MSRAAPVVSFVIPSVRGRRQLLGRCLTGIAREVRVPAEALVVVEGPEDAAPLAEYATDTLEIVPVLRDGGAARRRNAAFEQVRGRMVALLDDDAEPLPGYGQALEALLARTDAVLIQGAIWPDFGREPDPELAPVLFSLGGFNRHGELARPDVSISANWAFSKSVLDAVGPMREDLGPGSTGVPWGDDTEWLDRARRRGMSVEWGEALSVRHHIQAERISRAAVLARAHRVGRTLAWLEWSEKRPPFAVRLRQRALAVWAMWKARDLEGECLAARLRGYADELAGRG